MKKADRKNRKQTIWSTFKNDLKNTGLSRDVSREYKSILSFYLTPSQLEQTEKMSFFRKIFYIPQWLFRNLIFKLSPIRRILILLGSVLILAKSGSPDNQQIVILGLLAILFVVILELKDKLLASEELKTGHKVQQAMMPCKSPHIPGWQAWLFSQPANSVGGDLVDVFLAEDDRYICVLGDVSGKELGAALYMVKLQATLRALATFFARPGQLCSKINSIFYRDSESSRFATLAFVSLAPHSNKLKIVNAGHLPPLVWNKNKLNQLPRGNTALGIKEKVDYSEHKLELESNDFLVLYSDGITEAMNPDGEFFGLSRLRQLICDNAALAPETLGPLILKKVHDFVLSRELSDDLSLVIIKRA